MRIGISAMWLSSESSTRNSGLSRYAHHLIDELVRIGRHEYVAFVPDAFEVPADWSRRANLEVFKVATRGLAGRVAWEHGAPSKLVRRHRLDLWFSAAQAIPLRCPVPTAVMIHDAIPLLFPSHHRRRTVLYYRFALRHSARDATVVLANSECTKRDLMRLFAVGPERITVTPLGPGVRAKEEPGAFASLGVREPYLFALGNLEWRKNLHGLLETLPKLAADLTLVVGGGRRLTAGDIVGRRSRELGVADRVQMLGYVPDGALPELFRRSAAFVFPSLYEGFGLPVLEALSYGAVVACSDRSSIPEIPGDLAFQFDPESTDAMAMAITSAINAPDRSQRVRAGIRRASEFSWERTARETLAVLERAG